MKIINEYPPNYEEIAKTFDLKGKGPCFTYGDIIYNPHNGGFDKPLIAHEEVHCKQQGDNPKEWWGKYLKESEFRLSQELEAYRKQYQEAKKLIKDRNLLAKHLSGWAMDLSSPMYGKILSYSEALKLIRG